MNKRKLPFVLRELFYGLLSMNKKLSKIQNREYNGNNNGKR